MQQQLANQQENTDELIDTLWNVNVRHSVFCGQCGNELIDTLWNVNKHT